MYIMYNLYLSCFIYKKIYVYMCHCICIQYTYSDKNITIYKITKKTWKISIFMIIKNKKDYILYMLSYGMIMEFM